MVSNHLAKWLRYHCAAIVLWKGDSIGVKFVDFDITRQKYLMCLHHMSHKKSCNDNYRKICFSNSHFHLDNTVRVIALQREVRHGEALDIRYGRINI
jgi:hypothetical protein